jgi:hypothetical protein
MTATSIIKNAEVRSAIRAALGWFPPIPVGDLQVPAETSSNDHIGRAFDLLLKCELERRGTTSSSWNISGFRWNAIDGLMTLSHERLYASRIHLDADGTRFATSISMKQSAERFVAATELLARFTNAWCVFMDSGKYTHELVAAALQMSHLEFVARSGRSIYVETRHLVEVDEVTVLEVMDLLAITKFEHFVAPQGLQTNLDARLEAGYKVVGGADADIISGYSIIELKVVQDTKESEKWIHQMFLYLVFVLMKLPNGMKTFGGSSRAREMLPAFKLVLYLARHGEFVEIPAAEITDVDGIVEFAVWMLRWRFARDARDACRHYGFDGPLMPLVFKALAPAKQR